MVWRAIVVVLLLIACGSETERHRVSVFVRTDYVPDREFAAVNIKLSGASAFRERLEFADDRLDYTRSVKVAEFLRIPPGEYSVRLSLMAHGGGVMEQRAAALNVSRDEVVTVAVSRNPEPGEVDAGIAPPTCDSDLECDDGIFCNGVEVCDPMAREADSFGCSVGELPCSEADQCFELETRCEAICPDGNDVDGDGIVAIECGGTDCDDRDASVFPGAEESCDQIDHDCDPMTLGPDEDGDGATGTSCCWSGRCGTDCDDRDPAVNAEAEEVCDGIDNDCDELVDEGLSAGC